MSDRTKTTSPSSDDPAYRERLRKSCYILDHGWEFVENPDGGKADSVHLYKTWQRPFMTGVDLETAYAMQKGQEDRMGDKCPLEEAKKIVAGWPDP